MNNFNIAGIMHNALVAIIPRIESMPLKHNFFLQLSSFKLIICFAFYGENKKKIEIFIVFFFLLVMKRH